MTKAWFTGRLYCRTCRNPIQMVTHVGKPQTYIHIYATPEPHEAEAAGTDVLNWDLPKPKGGGYKLPRKNPNGK